jgi:hypothetical protein
MSLTLHGTTPLNVFQLYGADENSASFAIGWVLERSPAYRRLVTAAIFGGSMPADEVSIALQRHSEDSGYTDIEIQSGRRFHAILEAKRDWHVPGIRQLSRYVPRLNKGGAELRRLVTVSRADERYARSHLPEELRGVPLRHLAWSDLEALAKQAYGQASSFEEKLWLRQLVQHLREFVSMERQTDNNVFVVALGRAIMPGTKETWIEVVEKDKRYFHPVGNSWPVQPPNYIGFRYDGRLQSVHHIDKFEIVQNLAAYNSNWLETVSDRFVYTLGPPMRPPREMRTGKIYRNGRVRCAIDTLLSGEFDTISDARDETKRRLAETF